MSRRTPPTVTTSADATDVGFYSGMIMTPGPEYAKEVVQTVFELLGGAAGMAEWAKEHPTDFYTRIFPKLIPKQINAPSAVAGSTLESYLRDLDTVHTPGSATSTSQ